MFLHALYHSLMNAVCLLLGDSMEVIRFSG